MNCRIDERIVYGAQNRTSSAVQRSSIHRTSGLSRMFPEYGVGPSEVMAVPAEHERSSSGTGGRYGNGKKEKYNA